MKDQVLCAGDLAHGVVEGQTEHLDMEVNGVAGQIALWPAPVTVFEDETGVGRQLEVARRAFQEWEFPFLQQGHQWGQAGGADLLARPAVTDRIVVTLTGVS